MAGASAEVKRRLGFDAKRGVEKGCTATALGPFLRVVAVANICECAVDLPLVLARPIACVQPERQPGSGSVIVDFKGEVLPLLVVGVGRRRRVPVPLSQQQFA